MNTWKVILFVVGSIVGGALVMTVALLSGALIYSSNTAPDAPPNAEVLAYAINCGFLTYLLGLVPLKLVSYRSAGFKLTFVLFFLVPITVYLFWASIGASLSFYILWAVAALASYQTLVVYTRKERT